MAHTLNDVDITGELRVSGDTTIKQWKTVSDSTASRTCTSEDYGKTIVLSYATTVAVTLPANGAPAGSVIYFLWNGDDSLAATISAATIDTLIAPNDAEADSITYGSTHRIGAYCMFVSTGTYWVAINLGSTTMTVGT